MFALKHSFSLWIGLFLTSGFILLGSMVATGQESNQQNNVSNVPGVWRGHVRFKKPDLRSLGKIRFVTEGDYPPFNYIDEEGNLTGFNVDLAKAICDVLSTECDIKHKPWEELIADVSGNRADAIIASVRITKKTSAQVDFSDVYYATPARFVANQTSNIKDISPATLAGKRVAVKEKTAHEAFLHQFFPKAKVVSFFNHNGARNALKTGKVDYLFGDGIGLVFWLNGSTAAGCCKFVGGPYLQPRYFGHGAAIAVRKGNRELREVLNYSMNQLRRDGRFEELFLRYFPINFN